MWSVIKQWNLLLIQRPELFFSWGVMSRAAVWCVVIPHEHEWKHKSHLLEIRWNVNAGLTCVIAVVFNWALCRVVGFHFAHVCLQFHAIRGMKILIPHLWTLREYCVLSKMLRVTHKTAVKMVLIFCSELPWPVAQTLGLCSSWTCFRPVVHNSADPPPRWPCMF